MKVLPVLMGFVIAGAGWAQDTQVEDGKAAVSKAVDSALAAAGLRFKGKVDNQSSDNQMFQVLGMGRNSGFTGKFTATVSSGTILVTSEDKNGSFEIVKCGPRVIKRQVWEKEPRQIDEFAAEIACLIDLEKVKASLGKAKLGKPETREIDGKKVTVVKGTLPLKLVGADEDDDADPADLMNWQKHMKLTTVEIKAEFRLAEDGSLARLTYELGKRSKLLEMVKIQMGQMQGKEEEEEEEEDGKPHATVSYTLDVEACGADVKAEVPAELKKYFEK